MIEILHEYKKDWSMFTLASLLDKSRDFRLHLYVHEDDWADAPIDWVIANFDEVKIYQSWWRTENTAKIELITIILTFSFQKIDKSLPRSIISS